LTGDEDLWSARIESQFQNDWSFDLALFEGQAGAGAGAVHELSGRLFAVSGEKAAPKLGRAGSG
jgi:hypothetical protein